MRVFKFGGASVKDAASIRNVAHILSLFQGEQLLIVISAMGKTTNALENLAKAYFKGSSESDSIIKEIKHFHHEIIKDLLKDKPTKVYDEIDNLFIDLESIIGRKNDKDFDFIYDQIVSFGEIISTKIVSLFLNENGFNNRWIDSRNFIATDNTYREGKINWDETVNAISKRLKPIVEQQIVVTQGFIGRSTENATTTLGREGSDYSAAIFCFGLDAESVTIWKDVAGVMNADPKRVPDAKKIDRLTYNEAIELAYYGATVIHPKTIQPLKSKNIPLYVKSFLNPEAEGTVVSNFETENTDTTFFIFKGNQQVLHIGSKDLTFIVENNLKNIFSQIADARVKVNLMQNSAISFDLCVTYEEEKVHVLEENLKDSYHFSQSGPLELVTIRNYNDEAIKKITTGKRIVLEQKSTNTIQFAISE